MNDELKIKNNELGGKMNYRYRTAEEMKDSGVEWIGKIPKEWNVTKLKNLATIVTGNTPSKNDEKNYENGIVQWIKPDNITDDFKITESKDRLSTYGLKQARLIPKNSALVCCIGTVGKVGISEVECTTNQQINSVVFDNKNWVNGFGIYALISSRNEHERNSSKVVVSILNKSQQGNINMPVPKSEEQQKIAKFLDEKTAQFDSIISKKEALIEKLEEAKKSLISEVVTGKVKVVKSSDGYEVVERKKEEMKDSGVEWLGDIPKEWEVKAIKYLFSLRNERNYKEMGEVQLLSLYTNLGVLKQGDVEARGNKVRTVEDYKEVYPNDIIVNIILAWMGAIGMSEYRGVISPAYDIYEPINKNTISKYYHYVFRTGRFAGECYKKGRGIMDMRWRTYSDEFKSILVPDLSVEEKNIIVECIDKKINEVEALIKNIEEQIEKLKEAKQSLISEAVTGKIEILD